MEELIAKKSIFKQEQLKEAYSKHYYENGEPDSYPDINKQKINDDYYKYECNLSMPLLKYEDLFYIEEDDKMVKIKQVIRTSKDNVLYVCNPNVIEDRDAYNKLKEELKEEKIKWSLQHSIEESKIEVKGIRKLVKKLLKL